MESRHRVGVRSGAAASLRMHIAGEMVKRNKRRQKPPVEPRLVDVVPKLSWDLIALWQSVCSSALAPSLKTEDRGAASLKRTGSAIWFLGTCSKDFLTTKDFQRKFLIHRISGDESTATIHVSRAKRVLKNAEPALVTEQKLTDGKDEIRLTKKGNAVLRLMRADVEAELNTRLETLAEEEREALNNHFQRKGEKESEHAANAELPRDKKGNGARDAQK